MSAEALRGLRVVSVGRCLRPVSNEPVRTFDPAYRRESVAYSNAAMRGLDPSERAISVSERTKYAALGFNNDHWVSLQINEANLEKESCIDSIGIRQHAQLFGDFLH